MQAEKGEPKHLPFFFVNQLVYNSVMREGTVHSAETKQKIAQANNGRRHTPEELSKMRLAHLGKKHTEESKAKISETHLGSRNPNYGKHPSPLCKCGCGKRVKEGNVFILYHHNTGENNPMWGKYHSSYTKELISQRAKDNSNAKGSRHPKLSEYNRTHIRRGINNPNYGQHYGLGIPKSSEWKAKNSQTRIARGLSKGDKNPMAKKENVAKYFKSLAKRPTKPERIVNDILERYFPNEFKYNGDFSQGIMIAGLIPDFVNVNGRKQVIEVFGRRFHDPNVAKWEIKWCRTEVGRIMTYNSVGFDCLIIWEHELKDENQLIKKIRKWA